MNSIIPIKLIIENDNISKLGSGVLISLLNEKYDLVLTCAHCLEGVEILENIQLRCDVVKDTHIEVIDYYPKECSRLAYNNHDELDVGMIIINKVTSGIGAYIHLQEDEISNELFILGYPEIVKREDRFKAIKLKCQFQNEAIDANSIVVELEKSISETAATSEKERMDGFSGSPVYYTKNGVDTLIGLAKGVPITKDDSVAFDRVFILNIRDAIEYLRDKGLVIYSVDITSYKLYIKWVEDKELNNYSDKKILIIGGSGAGKSSFINTFSQNSRLIDSSGDGQTTRTNVEYNFSIYEPNPRVEIKLLPKEEFIENRVKTVKVELLEFIFWLIYGINYNLRLEIDVVIKKQMKYLKEIETSSDIDEKVKTSISDFIKNWDDINNNNKRTKRDDIISLNLELIRILKDIDENFDDSRLLTDNNKMKLKKILLIKKSFFDYREFDFIESESLPFSEKIEELFYCEFVHFNLEDIDFNKEKNKIESLFGKVYDLIINETKAIYGTKDLNATIRLDSSSDSKKMISRALKVVDGESITALIDKIEIYDNMSNAYSLIMDKLKLKQLILIDTCGLDHIETGEVPEIIIDDLFSKYNFDIKTIFYLKKLDSGKPTELEKIIPTIYSVHSNAIVYCIFSGIDIFYSNIENSIIDWSYEETKNSLPKAVNYIFNEGKSDILEALEKTKGKGVRSVRKNTIYSTLIKNLVPFCSIISQEKAIKFYENNLYHIEKLFKSIVLEEHLGLEVIPSIVFESMKSNIEYRIHVKRFLKDLFKEASIVDWSISNYGHGHYKTKDKNIIEINSGRLGFRGTYNDYWNYAFNQSYNELVSYETFSDNSFDKLLNVIKEECKASDIVGRIESAIIDFKDIFLGCEKYHSSVFRVENSVCVNCRVECFRKILLDMYNTGVYKYSLNEKPVSVTSHEWLNEICDFNKGFQVIEDKICNYFIIKLVEKLKIENVRKFDTVIEINPEIKNSYDKFLVEIEKGFLYKDSIEALSVDVFEYLSKLNK